MSNDRRKPGVAFWGTVVAVVTVAYPLSIGPAIWLSHRLGNPQWIMNVTEAIYGPLIWLAVQSGWVGNFYLMYVEWWQAAMPPGL